MDKIGNQFLDLGKVGIIALSILIMTTTNCGPAGQSESDTNDLSSRNSNSNELEADEIGEVFVLSCGEFDQSEESAGQGNVEAAFDIYMHIKVGGENYSDPMRPASHWLQLAADGGLPIAQQHLLTGLMWPASADSCRRAFEFIDRDEVRSRIENQEIRLSRSNIENCQQILSSGDE